MSTIVLILSRIAAIGTSQIALFSYPYNEQVNFWHWLKKGTWSKVPFVALFLRNTTDNLIRTSNIRISIATIGSDFHSNPLLMASTSSITAIRAATTTQTSRLTCCHTHCLYSSLFVFFPYYIVIQDGHYLTIAHLWSILCVHNSTVYWVLHLLMILLYSPEWYQLYSSPARTTNQGLDAALIDRYLIILSIVPEYFSLKSTACWINELISIWP